MSCQGESRRLYTRTTPQPGPHYGELPRSKLHAGIFIARLLKRARAAMSRCRGKPSPDYITSPAGSDSLLPHLGQSSGVSRHAAGCRQRMQDSCMYRSEPLTEPFKRQRVLVWSRDGFSWGRELVCADVLPAGIPRKEIIRLTIAARPHEMTLSSLGVSCITSIPSRAPW